MLNPNLSLVNYFNEFNDDTTSSNIDDFGIFIDDSGQLISMTTHAYHHRLSENPELATKILISRALRKMICFGAKPLAMSAFLYHVDVANEQGKKIASEVKKAIDLAANKFKIKVSDKKIRFDHFDAPNAVPMLIVTVLGTIGVKKEVLTHHFKSKGNNLFVIGRSHNDINDSEYLKYYHKITNSPFPIFNIDVEQTQHIIMKELIIRNLITSASPVGRGGLFFSLLRAGMPSKLGFDITTDAEIRQDAFLFGESMGRLIVGVEDSKVVDFVDYMQETDMSFFTLGHITKGEIRIDDDSYGFIDKMNN